MLWNTYNSTTDFCLHWLIGLYQALPIQAIVYLGVTVMTEYSIFLKAPVLEPYNLFYVIGGGLTLLHRYSLFYCPNRLVFFVWGNRIFSLLIVYNCSYIFSWEEETFPKLKFLYLFMIYVTIVIIIIIMSCHRHGYPWSSLATSPYRHCL